MSQDFLVPDESVLNTKLTEESLERLRVRLLDLSKRNTLLNFRDTHKTVQIIDELPNEVFLNLVNNGNEMLLLPLPKENTETKSVASAHENKSASKEKDKSSCELAISELDDSALPDEIEGVFEGDLSPFQTRFIRQKVRMVCLGKGIDKIPDFYSTDSPVDLYARNYANALEKYVAREKALRPKGKTNINTNQEVPTDDGGLRLPKHVDNYLQTTYESTVLERRCKKIALDARTALEETGSNLLYLAIGFLEWRESEDSSLSCRAPLVMVPLSIERKALDSESNCYRYGVSYTEEGIDTNLSLAHKLEKDFGLILPPFTHDTNGDSITPEQYLAMVEKAVSSHPSWSIKRHTVIGFFSFAKMQVYRDLDPTAWSAVDKSLTTHPILPRILAGISNDNCEVDTPEPKPFGEEYPIDDMSDVTPILLDADSSQHSAIIDTVQKCKNLVIEGPPGTGKSQTIANIIAAALNDGKTILFLAEKKAALNVVKRRLDAVGMGDFCLELHSHKAHKATTYEEIRRRMEKLYSSKFDKQAVEIYRDKELEALKAYSEKIGHQVGVTEMTPYDIFTSAQRWKAECGEGLEVREITSPSTP